MSIAAWRSRGRAHRSFLVALPPVRDLLLCAKHLSVAARTVWDRARGPARAGATQLGLRARGVVSLHLRTLAREGRMTVTIGRRELLAALGGAAAAWPLTARAQQPGKLPTIGFLVAGTPSSHGQWVAAFVQRLRELGWIEGRTVAIEY